MSLAVSRRRWRWVIWAAMAAGGGYATYRLYTSEAGRRKRLQVARLFGALFLFGDAARQSAESMALMSADLKQFLLSDDDELPRSLRQALKIAHSPEFQHSFSVLSAALTRGLIRGFTSPRPSSPPPPRPSPFVDDPACTEIKEICLISCADPPGFQKGRVQYTEKTERQTMGTQMAGPNIYLDKPRRQSESKPSEEFPERLLSKLFSEHGIAFASAVVGSAACDIVKALFEGFENQSQAAGSDCGSGKDTSSKIMDVLCTPQCKGLITDCIQTMVNTAVAVYIDRTKDVNFYEDMVAGITNPSYKDPMKDLLTSACNGAIETLVRSSHSVMFAKKSGQWDSDIGSGQGSHGYAIQELSDGLHVQSQMSVSSPAPSISTSIPCQGQSMSNDGSACTFLGSMESTSALLQPYMQGIVHDSEQCVGKFRQEQGGIQNLIDGVSKTLAIPSNHRLVVDVAGTMTSEAVRSFIDVIISTISSNLRNKMQRGWGRVKVGAIEAQTMHKDVAIKAFFVASICLAICLHLLTAIHIEKV